MREFQLNQYGMNNRASDTRLPDDKFRNAVNVDFGTDGKIYFPRIGNELIASGTDCHSWFEYAHGLGYGLFVDGTQLKRLNLDNTVTSIKQVGSFPMSYARIEDRIYFSNGVDSGVYILSTGEIKLWGIDEPPRQPTIEATSTGGMYAGEYRCAITWLAKISEDHYEESATFNSVYITVNDGGGIRLSDFPIPPAYIDKVAVYVSAVNGQDLYLYDEVDRDTNELYIRYNVGTIKLETQFKFKANPKIGLVAHYGRIYWINDTFVEYTEPQQYGMRTQGSYFSFEEKITNIVSVPGALYITTEKAIYRVTGIDGESPANVKIKTYGAPSGTFYYDNNDNIAYGATHNGFCLISSDGIQELAVDSIAIPIFKKGSASIIENNGSRQFISIMNDGTVSSLQHSDYTNAEIARGNTLAL